jgi:hypothetical protein
MKQLIEDLISAMEYHVEQTRPIHSTTVALQAAREALKAMPTPLVCDCNQGQVCHVCDPITPPAQPAPVPKGWKMVPVEPTREMWTAVNKLDDQCAAGNYDGKGCSIEQAWNCLLDAAPTPPAQPAPVQEPVAWPTGLIDRIKAAEQRIQDGHSPRRIPADPTDVDLVLAEVRYLLEGKQPPFWIDTTPPAAKRQWTGLTKEKIKSLEKLAIDPVDANGWGVFNRERFAELIEAKLKEKNT